MRASRPDAAERLEWLAFGGRNVTRHLELLRVFTGGFGADFRVVEDHILRRIVELMPDRGCAIALQARRNASFRYRCEAAANDAAVLAPWLDQDVA